MKHDQRHRPLWVVSELYYPEETSTGYFLTKIAEGLAASRPVRVVCGQPSYAARHLRAPSRELHNGVAIQRCWATTWNKDVWPLRLVNFLTISISIFLRLLFVLRRGDQALVVTNPPLLPYLVHGACRVRGACCFLLIHDAYPEVLVAAGLFPPNSWIVKLWESFARRLYRSVEGIAVLGRDMLELVQAKLPAAERGKAVIITNWADVGSVYPTPRRDNALLKTLGLSDKFVIAYAGNMGPLNNLPTVLDGAERLLRLDSDVHFLLIGSGAKRGWLERNLRKRALHNVTLLPPRPRSGQLEFLNACDVSMITLVDGMLGVSVPSRTYNVLAAGKPIIALVDPRSELARVVEEEAVGWVARPDDAEGFAQTILQAKSQCRELPRMGARARRAAERKYQLENILDAYACWFDETAGNRARPPRRGVNQTNLS